MSIVNDLNNLYTDIQSCHLCAKMDKEKSLRLVQAVNITSDVFVISQSLASNQLRRSGVNFFDANGNLGNTGENLEKFLNRFGRTVYPYQAIKILSDTIIPKCRPDYIPIYNTEITQCYPGPKGTGKGDRPPTDGEILNCINRRFLLREIELVNPRLLLLMGKSSRDSFFKYVLNVMYPDSLSYHILEIIHTSEIPQFSLIGRNVHVLPIQHASGVNPHFNNMSNNEILIKLIRKVLI